MKRAVIFYNGDLSDISRAKKYINPTDYLIGVDGGTEKILKLGLKPNIIIGDLDSLPEKTKQKLQNKQIEWITFNPEKNETDSELALRHAIKKGYTSITVFGFFGSRLDHLLTNIFALSYFSEKNLDVLFVEGNQEIQIIKKEITLKGTPGDLVSLIPLQGNVTEVTTTNLQYPLQKEDLYFGYSRGISNVMLTKTAKVSIKSGHLLVIHTKQ